MAKSKHDRIFMPKKPPHELTEDYLISKMVTRQICKPFVCGDDNSERSVNVSNYLARQNLRKVEKLLRAKRVSEQEKRRKLETDWEQLQEKEEELRQMFLDFNQFIIENSDKRARATEKIRDTRMLYLSRMEQVESMNEKCEELERIKSKMNLNIKVYHIYQEFLEKVVEIYPASFDNVHDVLKRYDVIKMTSHELMKHEQVEFDHLTNIKRELNKILERYIITVSGLNTKVSVLKQRHDEAVRESLRWEELYEKIRSKATEQVIDIVSIKDSCWRIYSDICLRKGIKPVLKKDHEGQLKVIKEAMRDLRNINDMARKKKAEEEYLSVKPCLSDGAE